MKERLLTFALAIGALALFYALMAPKPAGPQERVTRPVTTEKGSNGYAALWQWLRAEGMHPISMRDRFGKLAELSPVPAGNLLITTAPHFYPMRKSETAALQEWLLAGNTLLVVAGLSDTPDWSTGEGQDPAFMQHLRSMTGLTFRQVPDAKDEAAEDTDEEVSESAEEVDEPAEETGTDGPEEAPPPRQLTAREIAALQSKLPEPLQFKLAPNGPHPLLEGVESWEALSEYPTAEWRVQNTADLVLELGQNTVTAEASLWLARYGKGQVLVSAYGSILTNKLLGKADNARLLANIVNLTRSGDGAVIIDDAHQGLVAYYDPTAFFADKRLHATLWWLLGLWLVFVLGPQRLRAHASSWQPVDITSFVRASGGFLARALKPAVAGERLFANFFNDIRRHVGLPASGAPMWDWMSARGSVAPADVAQLQALHAAVLGGRKIDVAQLQNLLVRVRQELL